MADEELVRYGLQLSPAALEEWWSNNYGLDLSPQGSEDPLASLLMSHPPPEQLPFASGVTPILSAKSPVTLVTGSSTGASLFRWCSGSILTPERHIFNTCKRSWCGVNTQPLCTTLIPTRARIQQVLANPLCCSLHAKAIESLRPCVVHLRAVKQRSCMTYYCRGPEDRGIGTRESYFIADLDFASFAARLLLSHSKYSISEMTTLSDTFGM